MSPSRLRGYNLLRVWSASSRIRWIATINSGWRRTLGTAASFRLDDNRLILIGTYICPKALEALAGSRQDYTADNFAGAMMERRKVNVTSLCMGVQENQPPHPAIGLAETKAS